MITKELELIKNTQSLFSLYYKDRNRFQIFGDRKISELNEFFEFQHIIQKRVVSLPKYSSTSEDLGIFGEDINEYEDVEIYEHFIFINEIKPEFYRYIRKNKIKQIYD